MLQKTSWNKCCLLHRTWVPLLFEGHLHITVLFGWSNWMCCRHLSTAIVLRMWSKTCCWTCKINLKKKNTFKMPAPLPGSSAAVHPHLRIPPLQFPLPIWQPRHLSWALEPASFCCSCLAPVVPKLPECLLGGLCSDLRFVALWSYSHQSLQRSLPDTPYLSLSDEFMWSPPPLSFSTANLKGHVLHSWHQWQNCHNDTWQMYERKLLTSRAPTGHRDGPGSKEKFMHTLDGNQEDYEMTMKWMLFEGW